VLLAEEGKKQISENMDYEDEPKKMHAKPPKIED